MTPSLGENFSADHSDVLFLNLMRFHVTRPNARGFWILGQRDDARSLPIKTMQEMQFGKIGS